MMTAAELTAAQWLNEGKDPFYYQTRYCLRELRKEYLSYGKAADIKRSLLARIEQIDRYIARGVNLFAEYPGTAKMQGKLHKQIEKFTALRAEAVAAARP